MTALAPPPASDQAYAVTPLEIFFDLVFVFAVSQLSHHLLTHLDWRGAVETLVLLRAVYGVWYSTSWAATMIPVEALRTRAMLLAVMLLGLFMNAAVSRAFTTSGWAFVIPLLLIQLGRTVWTIANAPNRVFRDHYFRALLWFLATAPVWIAGAAANPATRLLWWALAAGLEQVGAWLGHPLPRRWLHSEHVGFAGGHMLERCWLFLVIALGETVLTTGTAIAEDPLTPMTVVTGALALCGTVALWALGSGSAAQLTVQYTAATPDPVRASRYAVNTLLPLVAGLIAVAVANEVVIAHPLEHASALVRGLLFGGPMVYLMAQGWYQWAGPHVRPRFQVTGSAVLAVLGLATATAPAYVALIMVGVSLSALAILDRR
jgi:low temperature requirement protein LtrA